MAQHTTYQPTDPIISSNFSPFSPSVSRVRQQQPADASTSVSQGQARVQSRSSMPFVVSTTSETAPLLGNTSPKKPFYRPRPLWLVPFAIVASIVRGMTLAPRVQVYTQLSCNNVYGHDVYDHTGMETVHSVSSFHPVHAPFYLSLDPHGPQLDTRPLSLSVMVPYPQGQSDRPTSPDTIVTFAEDNGDESDPRMTPAKRCLTDSAVQRGAARIQTSVTTVMGTLSALTTGWWGHFGEQHGRMRVLAAATLGLFLTDLTFILVSTPHSTFAAHGNKLLLVSSFLEGLLGGWSTLQGATSAYISDCTSDGSRAQIFSRFTGVFYVGFSVGPSIGAYLIRHPLLSFPGSPTSSSGHGPNIHNGQPTMTSVFYVAAMCSFVNLMLVLFFFPDTTDKRKAKAEQKAAATAALSLIASGESEGVGVVGYQSWFQHYLSPLSFFKPKRIPEPEGGYRRDWSLTILGVALFLFLLSAGIFQIKYLYAGHVYEWDAEKLSYYITFVGAVRALHLLFLMPHLIAAFKPKPKPTKSKGSHSVSVSVHGSVSASVSVHAHAHASAVVTPSSVAPATPKKPKRTLAHLAREMNFDLLLLRTSFFVECLSHTLVAVAPASLGDGFFVAFTTLSCFGAGVIPAANSLALCIMQMQAQAHGLAGSVDDDSAGRVFGALAALQAVGQMVLGPLVFGIVYSSTVATFPKGIFVTAACITFTAVVLLCLLRPDVSLRLKQQRRLRWEEEVGRGRSRVSKDLSKNVSQIFMPASPSSYRYNS